VVSLPIALNVLDAELPGPNKIYGMFMRASRRPEHHLYVDDVRYRAQLRAMRELGINALKLDAFSSMEKLDESLGWIREAGFSGPIVLQGREDPEYVRQCAALLAKHGYPPLFYGVDEPNASKDARYRKFAKAIHEGGGKVVSAMRTDVARAYVEDGLIDVPILSHVFIPGTEVSKAYAGPETWVPHMADASQFVHRLYYFQSWAIGRNRWLRLWYGFYLYRSGFDGAMPYCLMAFHKGLPYHTDVRVMRRRGKPTPMLMFCTAYPSQEGPVPTLQWEAYREGITDMRWIRLYENLDKASGGALGRETLHGALQPFFYRGTRVSRTELKRTTFPEPEAAVFDKAREMLITAIAAHLRGKKTMGGGVRRGGVY